MAIPFKSIRYVSGEGQTWGVQIRRYIRRKNEFAFLTFVPALTGGSTSICRVSAAADLVRLDLPSAGKNIEIKPYATSSLASDLTLAQPVSNDGDGDVGIDIKYGITANITADLTYNTHRVPRWPGARLTERPYPMWLPVCFTLALLCPSSLRPRTARGYRVRRDSRRVAPKAGALPAPHRTTRADNNRTCIERVHVVAGR